MNFFDFFKKIAKSRWFDNFITIVILLAGVVVGLQTSQGLNHTYGFILNRLDEIILAIFVIEIIINVFAEGKRPWRFFYNSWHTFDLIIVLLCFIPYVFPESNTQFFAVLRLARILRLARLFEKVKNLKILLFALLKGIPKMSYVIILLFVLFYIYGVIGTDIFGKEGVPEFANLWLSMKSLFIVMFEGWSRYDDSEVINALIDNGQMSPITVFLYFVSFLFISAMIFLNLFIGIITSDMESVKAEEKRGKSKFYKTNHTIILGWSMSIFKIIQELVEANDSREKAYILVLADIPKEDMEFDISQNVKYLNTTKVVCRSGSPADLTDLKIINLWQARSIILLGDETKDESDLMILKSLIAIMNHTEDDQNEEMSILAEMHTQKMIKIAKSITNGKAIFFESQDFIARLIAQTSLQPYLSNIYEEITGFAGSELYIINPPKEIVGIAYKDLLFRYDASCPIGVISEHGKPIINPPLDYKILETDELILLAEDDSTIKLTNHNYEISNHEILEPVPFVNRAHKLLILGSNSKLPIILKEINDYLKVKSSVKIITSQETAADECFEFLHKEHNKKSISLDRISMDHISIDNLDISFKYGDIDDIEVLENELEGVDQVTLLSYFDEMNDVLQADAITLVTLIHLRSLSKSNKYKFSITTEIIDSHNHELINNPDVCDFIVSSKIISSILAQLSEQKELKKVFEVLFEADGAEIYLRPAKNYCTIGAKVNFATLLQSAILKNETAIGYILGGQTKTIVINPTKKHEFTISEDDTLVVLAED